MSRGHLLLCLFFISAIHGLQYQRFKFGTDWHLIAINDLEIPSAGNLEFFLDGPFGPQIDPKVLFPKLTRIGYNVTTSPPEKLILPINTLYAHNLVSGQQLYFDTGLGANISRGAAETFKTIQFLGIDPNEIDFIFISHGHGDHSGGLMHEDYTPLFPKATLVMGRDDYDLFMSPDPNWADFCCPELLNSIQPWVQRALSQYTGRQLVLLNSTTASNFKDAQGVEVEISGGHTSDDHMTIKLTSQDAGYDFYILGDSFISGYHMEDSNVGCSHDHHRVEAIQTRIQFRQKFAPKDLLFAMHFAFPGTGFFDNSKLQFTYYNPQS